MRYLWQHVSLFMQDPAETKVLTLYIQCYSITALQCAYEVTMYLFCSVQAMLQHSYTPVCMQHYSIKTRKEKERLRLLASTLLRSPILYWAAQG